MILSDDTFVWGNLFSSVLDQIFKERAFYPTKDEIETFLFNMEDLEITVSGDPMTIVKFNL